MVESEGCALFGGLIDPVVFEKLVTQYDKVQSRSGNNAFMHSYFSSHLSYLMGGAIRIVEFRGKNTNPISIAAQDNMLHVDNTPFKEEYKVLLNWRRGQVKGPCGQNVTFLPWTHKGNRAVQLDEEGQPWSSERDSLFVSQDALEGLFDFQRNTKELFRPSHPSQIVDIERLALEGDRLAKWRDTVMGAPSPMIHKFNENLLLSETDFSNPDNLTDRLAAVMDYDKHCNLQMILYNDGREEIRRPGRKIIGEMKKDAIISRLQPWTSELRSGSFSAHDLVEPKILRVMCDAIAALAKNLAQGDGSEENMTLERVVGQQKIFMSLSRLMMDLGEAIVRCKGIEAFVATSLFLFWSSEEIYSHLRESDQLAFRSMLVVFLRNYVATVLLVESSFAS
ncbi:hypothetical protein BKA65DRAFT_573682 [Rhexocercosporidium sp. MPI-PUGE-AT-0058]|nr:hypothetical protein BKA65DRAFT_573682 [Rhexocercosporidium sp. MPI-PUGE-AT-0058]